MNIFGYIIYLVFLVLIIFIPLRIITKIKSKKSGSVKDISVPIRYIEKRFNLEVRETKAKKMSLFVDLVNSLATGIPLFLYLFVLKTHIVLTIMILVMIFTIIVLTGYTIIGTIFKRKEK